MGQDVIVGTTLLLVLVDFAPSKTDLSVSQKEPCVSRKTKHTFQAKETCLRGNKRPIQKVSEPEKTGWP